MIFRVLVLFIFIIPSLGISQTFTTVNSIIEITNLSSSSIDSVLVIKGFTNTSIEGLKFNYAKKSESIEMYTMPRKIVYTFSDKATYLTINSEISSGGFLLTNEAEVLTYNGKPKTVSTFEKSSIKISLGTDYNASTKATNYIIWVNNSSPGSQQKTDVKTEVKTEVKSTPVEVQAKDTMPVSVFGSLIKVNNPKSKKITPKDTTANSSGDNIVPVPRRATLGVGLYNIESSTSIYSTMGTSFHFGVEMTKAALMKKKNNLYKNTRLDLEGSAYVGMAEGSGDAEITIRKYFLSIGAISEVRYKKVSFLIKCSPAANLTTGKRYGDDAKASFFTVALNAGEYIQWNTGKTATKQDKMFVRLGFDQFISLKGDYIGSFGLTLGF